MWAKFIRALELLSVSSSATRSMFYHFLATGWQSFVNTFIGEINTKYLVSYKNNTNKDIHHICNSLLKTEEEKG